MTTLAVNALSTFATRGVQGLKAFAFNAATNAITQAFDDRVYEGPRLDSFHLQTSRDGAPMPRVFGRARLAGQVIWASQIRETTTEERVGGGKGGGPVRRDYSYTISFAVGLCEGEILGVDRIWANGEILQRSGLTIRVHRGGSDQGPDPVIAATETGEVPAFRGTAYIVFEDFPLDEYGARLPIINAEIVRGPRSFGREDAHGKLEHMIRSVNLLPGTGEFALSTKIVEETPAPGVTTPVNMNSLTGEADIVTALDQLQSELPNCRHVNLIVSWFGSSTDCGQCEIRPGAERRDRRLLDDPWAVDGNGRRESYIVSADEEGRPHYGGTPSDASVIECVKELQRRGLAVTLYPFLLIDASGFPWRGRISSPRDRSNLVHADINAFFGDDHDHRFRHHILHYARLAKQAGGVDAFVIGSELSGLMRLRDAGSAFPAVAKMKSLAQDAKAILGDATALTYAADWSDYFGYHPADGSDDVYYHLDPLWADPSIDAVGIDAYFPLSDWRDGDDHLDAGSNRRGHDLDYLRSQVEGGEGYDWYYASDADRQTQTRSPIDDPVYRYKDVRHWWSSDHYDRRGGVPAAQTSEWQPRSKPVWLLEIGCPAVNKGANQPNVFNDGRSVDSALPYFSDGSRDDLIQRRYLEALIGYWSDHNEPGFIDTSRLSVWAWDARPYPYYPARSDVWSDGASWQRGHWLNGRMGLMPVAEIVEDLARASGLTAIDVSGVSGVVPGYVIDRPMSARAALEPLLSLFAIEMSERDSAVHFAVSQSGPVITLDPDQMVEAAFGPVQYSLTDPEARMRDVRLTYIDAARDYQTGSTSARNDLAESVAVMDLRVPAIIDEGLARHVAERELSRRHQLGRNARFAVPLREGLKLHTGDRVRIGQEAEIFSVQSLQINSVVEIEASLELGSSPWVSGATPSAPRPLAYSGPASLLAFDLPDRRGVSVGAVLSPFIPVEISADDEMARLQRPVHIGATLTPLLRETPLIWDRRTVLDIQIEGLSLASLDERDLLSEGNRFAVETPTGWEVFASAKAELIGPATYRLSNLLRGLSGSEAWMADEVPAGARILWLGHGSADVDHLQSLELDADWRGEVVTVTGQSGGRESISAEIEWTDAAGEPLSPVHPRVIDTRLSWIPRHRAFTGWTEETWTGRFRITRTVGGAQEIFDTTETAIPMDGADRIEVQTLSADGRLSPPLIVSL